MNAPRINVPRLILASASPRRADILRQLGLEPSVLPAHVDETHVAGESPATYVERLARDKASAIAALETHEADDVLVIGGDTVVVLGDRLLGKPAGPIEATDMLRALSGREHVVLSGMAIAGSHGVVSGVSSTTVRMRDTTLDELRAYVATGEPLDKAGSYGIQGLGAALVDGIDGDYYSVVGFPVPTFVTLLERAGWRFLFGALTRIGDP